MTLLTLINFLISFFTHVGGSKKKLAVDFEYDLEFRLINISSSSRDYWFQISRKITLQKLEFLKIDTRFEIVLPKI